MSVSVRAMHGAAPIPEEERPRGWRERLAALRYLPALLHLVWQTHRGYTGAMIVLRLLRAFVPVAGLWVAKLIIDQVVHLAQTPGESLPPSSGALLLRNWRRAMHRSNGDRHADKLIRVAVESSSRLRGNAQTRGAHEPR